MSVPDPDIPSPDDVQGANKKAGRAPLPFKPSGGQRRREAEQLAKELTPRQREVLTLLLRGSAVKEIAAALDLSQHTVNEYVKQLHRHFKVSSRGELLALFVPTFY